MPRMTAKYKGAINIAHVRNLPITDNQEELYTLLQQHGFFWNSQNKVWEEFDKADADVPTPLIMLRVWADLDIVDDVADDIARLIEKKMPLRQIKRSQTYQNRPPKQLEGRVYLEFVPV